MAVIGVGIDVVDLERFAESLARTPGLAERLFTRWRVAARSGVAGGPVRREGGAGQGPRRPRRPRLARRRGGLRVLRSPAVHAARDRGRPGGRAGRRTRPPLPLPRRRHRVGGGGAGVLSPLASVGGMRSAHTVEEVRAAEAALMRTLPEGALMQRAAAGLANAVLEMLGRAYGAHVLLLVGSGDNGGDALYAGALLARRGVRVSAWLLSEKPHEAGLAALDEGRRTHRHRDAQERTRPRRRRDRRDRRAAGAEARGPAGPRGADRHPGRRRGRPERRRRGHRRAATGPPYAPTSPSRSARTRSPSSRTRLPSTPASCTSSTSASTSRTRESRASRPTTSRGSSRDPPRAPTSTPAASSASGPAPCSTPVPACSASPGPPAGCAGWSGTSPGPATRSSRRTPTW